MRGKLKLNFYSKFLRRSIFSYDFKLELSANDFAEPKGIFKENLDSALIRDYFFERIKEIEFYESMGEFPFDGYHNIHVLNSIQHPPLIHRELKWRVNLKHSFRDIKSRITTIIITGHYYIFSSEEDLFTTFLTSIKRCFSTVNNTLGEALNNLFQNYTHHVQYTKPYR